VKDYTLPCCGKVCRTLDDVANHIWFEDDPDRGPECHCGKPSAVQSGACADCFAADEARRKERSK
jgi:hypothetical protein